MKPWTMRALAAKAFLLAWAGSVLAQPVQGPSSSELPYVSPTGPGWSVTSLLTVGNGAAQNSYRMVGLPDGLGAIGGAWSAEQRKYLRPDLYLTVFMNHEIRSYWGVPRAHGRIGAFVSQWTIELDTLKVLRGEDLIRRVMTWNGATNSYQETTGTTIFDRFCSGDLPRPTAFFHAASGRGTPVRLFLNAEEADVNGRVFAHVVSGAQKGTSYELPFLGKAKWENALAHPASGTQTVVAMLEDRSPGQLYLYVGSKQSSGNLVQRAGLQGGKLYAIKVTEGGPNYGGGAVRTENAGAINGRFVLVDLSAYALASSDVLDTRSDQAGVTEFARPEDGHWDPTNPRVFYFNVTGSPGQSARLYRLRFDGTTWPAGGSIELVVDSATLVGTDGQTARGFDNLTVSPNGVVMVQEDGGGEAYLSKTWRVKPANPLAALQVLRASPTFFSTGGARYLTSSEEMSGIIDVTQVVKPAPWFQSGRRYYLATIMDHSTESDPELVQGGQFYLFSGPN
ncbi:MAG TPA: alkaline phosphatase PhoX [Steroidobacteraceae bacterium]|nr:alkaline phosphatase PhoX [Steroidobacteraceae bacterium]